MAKRRKYSEEFRREAVNLTRQPDTSVSQVARDIGVNAGQLFRGRREFEGDSKSYQAVHAGARRVDDGRWSSRLQERSGTEPCHEGAEDQGEP